MKITVNSILFHAAYLMHDKKEDRDFLRGVTFTESPTKKGLVMFAGNGQAMIAIYDPHGEFRVNDKLEHSKVWRVEMTGPETDLVLKSAKSAATETTHFTLEPGMSTLNLETGAAIKCECHTEEREVNVYHRVMDWPSDASPDHLLPSFSAAPLVEKFAKVAKVLTEMKAGPMAFLPVKYGQTLVTFRNYPSAFGVIISWRGDINANKPDWF